jgi:hypothetical protein
MYTHQVNFEKVFTSGTLTGRRYHAYLRFCTLVSAQQFAARAGEIFQACDGSGWRYRMEAPIISTLE